MRAILSFFAFLSGYTLSQFFRSFLAVIAPELAHDLALDPQVLGNLQASWLIAFSLMQFPVGFALDLIGPRRTVLGTMLFAVIGALLFAYATSAMMLITAMALIGIGCSAVYMGALFVFARIFPVQRFALFGSWLIGIGSAGNLMAATPFGWLATTIGWRDSVLVATGLLVAAIIFIGLFLKDPPHVHHDAPSGFWRGLGEIFSVRALWPLIPIASISYATLLAERGLWAGPYFASVHGLDPVQRGNALLIMAAAMSVGALAYGPLDRILKSRKWITIIGTLVTAACFFWLGYGSPSTTDATILLALIGAFGITYGVLMAHARQFFPAHLLGRGLTLMNMLFIGGAGIMQPISGAFMKAQAGTPPAEAYAALHQSFALALVISVLIYVFAQENPRAEAR